MKRTLLLLALLVTGELGFQTTEACISYYQVYIALFLGYKDLLNALLYMFDPTDEEEMAVDKVQVCHNEAGLQGKITDVLLLHIITESPECQHYYPTDIKDKIREILSKLMFRK